MSDTPIGRYMITLQYDGSAFEGWQIQSSGRTIQGTIEDGLRTILRRPLQIVGAGRTDTGVHAGKMVIHIDYPENQEHELPQLFYRLNRFLTKEILILSIHKVSPDFHARFSATSRTYHYYISLIDCPFTRHYHAYIPWDLDFEKMNETAQHLIGTKDFTTFSKTNTDVYTHICTVNSVQWVPLGDHKYRFEITANRFLRNMVRSIVGTLIDVGRGKITSEEFAYRLAQKDRAQLVTTAPANGLFLTDISYPKELIGELLWHVESKISYR